MRRGVVERGRYLVILRVEDIGHREVYGPSQFRYAAVNIDLPYVF